MERPHGTKMEDWQLGGLVSPDGSAGGLLVHEALQQSINRYALPLRFLPDSRFGLRRRGPRQELPSRDYPFILRLSRSFVMPTLPASRPLAHINSLSG